MPLVQSPRLRVDISKPGRIGLERANDHGAGKQSFACNGMPERAIQVLFSYRPTARSATHSCLTLVEESFDNGVIGHVTALARPYHEPHAILPLVHTVTPRSTPYQLQLHPKSPNDLWVIFEFDTKCKLCKSSPITFPHFPTTMEARSANLLFGAPRRVAGCSTKPNFTERTPCFPVVVSKHIFAFHLYSMNCREFSPAAIQ